MAKQAVASDLEFMQQPNLWRRLVLPLKTREEVGILVVGESGVEPIVWITNMWDIDPGCEKRRFASFEDILAAGWRID